MSASSLRREELVDVALPPVVPLRESVGTAASCRMLDVVLSGLMLILLAPLFALVAVAIWLDSGRPVFFRQRRFGIGLTTFTIYKFRTMRTDTSAAPHRQYVVGLIRGARDESGLYKLRGDQRITRVGRVLRRFSLDELPQLWNALRGDMSLVGPRPALPYEVEWYPREWMQRFSVRPGITGLWQVSGRNQLNFDGMVQLDLDYARRRSLWLNLRILARTPWVVVHGKGAA
jgi:lipopolysaccharide/colanic/teichoic acid biosynthesis glycosyltransferase